MDVTNWKPTYKLSRSSSEPNKWVRSIALAPGTYHYKFVVDEGLKWDIDPKAPIVTNEEGIQNNFVEVKEVEGELAPL